MDLDTTVPSQDDLIRHAFRLFFFFLRRLLDLRLPDPPSSPILWSAQSPFS